MKNVIIAVFSLRVPLIFGGSTAPANYWWQDRETTRLNITNKEETGQKNTNKWIQKPHTHVCNQNNNKKEPTASACRFDKQTFRAECICSCKWRDGSEDQLANYLSCWLLWLSLISPFSLFTFHWKSEVNLHLVLITAGSQQPPSLPSNPPTRTSMREKEQLS